MRAGLGLAVLSSMTSIAFVGCRIDYDEVPSLLLASAGSGARGGSPGTGGTSDEIPVGGEAGAQSSGVGGAMGGTSGGKGSGGTATSGGTGNAGGAAGSGTGGSSASGGTGGSGGSAGKGGSGGSSGAPVGGSSGSGSGGSSGTGGASAGSAGQGTGGSAGSPSLPDCVTSDFNGSTYLLCAPEFTWVAARDACASVGMELARVDDATENQWLFDNAFDLDTPSDGLWIGGSDEIVEGEWRWSDGTLFWLGDNGGMAQGGLYTNWYSNHPGGNTANDCLVIDLGLDTMPGWYSDRCDSGTNVFVCESL